jgi:ABC-type antimicrobial peptide transport system permease subunit
VGVVGDVKQKSLAAAVLPTLYRPHLQSPYGVRSMMVLLRAGVDARASVATISSRVRALDRALAVADAEPMDALVDESLSAPRFNLRLLGAFAALALALAAVGTFGVMRYIVGQRTAEIGLRMALGAGRARVLAEVLREGLSLTVAGVTVGVLASLALARTMPALSSLLHDVTPFDPSTFAVVILVLVAVAALACWSPARQATGIDPTVALRSD